MSTLLSPGLGCLNPVECLDFALMTTMQWG